MCIFLLTISRMRPRSTLLLLILHIYAPVVFAQVTLGNVALEGAALIDVDHPVPSALQTVLISGNRISRVFRDGSERIPDSFHIIKLDGRFLLPGLMDSHVHMATDPSGTDNRAQTLDVLSRMLHSGITTVRDMAGDARVLAGLARDAATGEIISPDIYYSALMAGPVFFTDPRTALSSVGGTPGKMPYMLAVTDSTDLRLAIAAAKGAGAWGLKLYADLSAALVRKITAEAARQKMPVWGHAWLDEARPSDLVDAGLVSISHAPLMIYEKMDSVPAAWKTAGLPETFWNEHVPDLSGLFARMRARHTILDATLLTYRLWGMQVPGKRYNYEIGRLITERAYKAGVAICAGTDDDQAAFVQKEMELLVHEAGMSPIDAIIAATFHTAQLLQISDSKGSIGPGKIADLLILDKNPLEDINNIESVFLVIKNGRLFNAAAN